MFKIKKLVTAILIFSFVLPIAEVNAYAIQEQTAAEEISFEEYYSAVKEEYAKYGIEYEIIEKNDDVVLTKGILQEQLELVRQQNDNLSNDNNLVHTNLSKAINIFPKLMPVTYTSSMPITVYSPSGMGYAELRIDANITENADTGMIMSVNSVTCYQLGSYLNFKSWTVNSISKTVTSAYADITVNGQLVVEYIEPKTGLLVGYTSNHILNCVFFPKY